jgi:NTP pyrophosphatase (non-canonical NTP hydrolase)
MAETEGMREVAVQFVISNGRGDPSMRDAPAVNMDSNELAQIAREDAEAPAVSADAVHDVLAERGRQDAKWGEQNHDPFLYLSVLMEEVGELAQAALHSRFGGKASLHIREEAVHTAAVALAIIECLDRGKWEWGNHATRSAALASAPVSEGVRERIRIAIERRFNSIHHVEFGDYETLAAWVDGILDEAGSPASEGKEARDDP